MTIILNVKENNMPNKAWKDNNMLHILLESERSWMDEIKSLPLEDGWDELPEDVLKSLEGLEFDPWKYRDDDYSWKRGKVYQIRFESDGRKLDFIKPGMIALIYIDEPYSSSKRSYEVQKVDDKGVYFDNENKRYFLWEQVGYVKIYKPEGNQIGIQLTAKYGCRAFNRNVPEDAREGLVDPFNDTITFLNERVEGSYHEWQLD